MVKEESNRNYKGGSWDLRKNDRRRYQETISFPDRRQQHRRATSQDEAMDAGIDLTWVSKSRLDA